MGKKLRASLHNGREGNPIHNGREGSLGANIDPARTKDNLVWCWDAEANPEGTLEESERHYYERFEEWRLGQNARYRDSGHHERQRDAEAVYKSERWRPEETILQVGNIQDGSVQPDTFTSMVQDYVGRLQAWSASHGEPFKILNYAIHLDESTPHCHLRRAWQYRDGNGNLRPGQDKALEVAGVERPKPEEPQGRYNNRKMAFDAMARQIWIDTARQYGLEIEAEPLPRKRSLSLSDMVREREADFRARMADLAQKRAGLRSKGRQLNQKGMELDNREKALEGRLEAAQEALELAQAARRAFDSMIADLPAWRQQAQKRYAKAHGAADRGIEGAAARLLAEAEAMQKRDDEKAFSL